MEFRFDRYRKGVLMAEGITVTKAQTLEQAILTASKMADDGDVVVYTPRDMVHVATATNFTCGSYQRNYTTIYHEDVPEGTKLYMEPPFK